MKKSLVLIIAVLVAGAYPVMLRAQTLELDYSTYLGGDGQDISYAIALDSDNSAYVAGSTSSSNFPTLSPYQSSYSGGALYGDVFVSKISSSGSSLLYSTYLGGSADDIALAITLDGGRFAYITGYTESDDFPTKDAYQSSRAGDRDIFITQLFPSGSSLFYSTYLGGIGNDEGAEIKVDSLYRPYIVGYVQSSDFPTLNPYQSSLDGGSDAFVTKFHQLGSELLYSTYLGGSGADYGSGIDIDSFLNAYITGYTNSSDFPTENPYQSDLEGGYDAFVSQLSSSGSSLIYSTFLGGNNNEFGNDIAVDTAGSPYVTGQTYSVNFPTVNSYQPNLASGNDAFVTRFSSSGSSLIYSSYLGGDNNDQAIGIEIDSSGSAHVIGDTNSSDFPTMNPYQASHGNYLYQDVFITRFSTSGTTLIYSTYLGGYYDDEATSIALNSNGWAYISGGTGSADFPTVNPYQSSRGSIGNAFVCKLVLIPIPTPAPPWIYDYNGDGTSDIAIFRPSSGLWAVRGVTRVYFGGSADEPVPGDYDGNGTTDIGIFRSLSGLWAVRGVTRVYFGSGADQPEPGDYDGDGTEDIGIFRSASGLWAIRGVTRVYFGSSSDEPSPGYYSGNPSLDIGLFRPSSGLWAIRGVSRIYFGASTDIPRPGDYDGDGVFEVGIFRPSSGLWAIKDVTRKYFGGPTDLSVPADYNGAGNSDIGIYRSSAGLWAAAGVTRVYFGTSEDIPATR